jgi:hypothetical protein
MTQERATNPKQTLARLPSITGQATAATPGPWASRPSASRTTTREQHRDVGGAAGCQRGVGGPAQPSHAIEKGWSPG